MKIKFLFLVALVMATASVGFAQRNKPNPLSATFVSSRVVHRVKMDNKWWMVVYATFKVRNALSNPCQIIAYFYNDSDGKPLKAGNYPKYHTVNGFVSASAEFTPGYDDANYTDLKIYIPYEALNLDSTPGNQFNLKYYLSVRDASENVEIAKSPYYKFSLKY